MSDATYLVATDEIAQTLKKFDPGELLEVINGLKQLIKQSSSQAREVLANNPDLAYSMVQALLLMGLIDEKVIQDAMEEAQHQLNGPAVSQKPDGPVRSSEDKLKGLDPAQAKMIQSVLSLTEENIAQLPAEQQNAIRDLKRQYG